MEVFQESFQSVILNVLQNSEIFLETKFQEGVSVISECLQNLQLGATINMLLHAVDLRSSIFKIHLVKCQLITN